ncbi:hypothetical protein N7490_002502 [Penicillium lividum]|nr:hypothetical protein N7490_002502 [Penicillium lividum]
MFGHRPNFKKPDQGLINKFQETFSDVVRPSVKCDHPSAISIKGDVSGLTTQNIPGLRFTPFLDDTSLPTPSASPAFNSQDASLLNGVFHGPAGDLHTPTVQSNPFTPRTFLEQFAVTPLHRDKTGISYQTFDPQFFAAEPQGLGLPWSNQSAAYPPSAFVHSDLTDAFVDDPCEQLPLNLGNHEQSAFHLSFPEKSVEGSENSPRHGQTDFRYQVNLNTPTAMIHHPNDAPVTYLNKGHKYSLSITDSQPPLPTNGLVTYRTSIRVSFEEPGQASNPDACWRLWKEARGHEMHREGGIHAVEMIDLSQENKDQSYPIQLERASLDGFCVIWCTNPATGPSSCTMGIRFNFLSTDFSHAKGVKGAPLRLCAKTEAVLPLPGPPELNYCNVKLFRDHGAERKMFNDVSQLKRAIEKRKADFAKPGSVNLGKRKRDSRLSFGSNDLSESELQANLDAEVARMQSLFYSNRPVTNFCLPGEQKDDPDLFPVKNEQVLGNVKKPNLQTVTPSTSISASGSSHSSEDPQLPEPQGSASIEWDSRSGASIKYSSVDGIEGPSELASSNTSGSPGLSTGDFEPMDLDAKPNEPSEHSRAAQDTPARCLYLRFQQSGVPQDDFHTAVYLSELTVEELAAKISQKQNFGPDQRLRLFHVKPDDMKVLLDDDVVQRIPGGQAMAAELSESTTTGSMPAAIEVRLYF